MVACFHCSGNIPSCFDFVKIIGRLLEKDSVADFKKEFGIPSSPLASVVSTSFNIFST